MSTQQATPGAVSQFAVAVKLIDISKATTALLATLPSIDLDSISLSQRQGFLNSLDRLHVEIHKIKQQAGAVKKSDH